MLLFAFGTWCKQTDAQQKIRNAFWIGWLAGQVIIGYLRRYGAGAHDILPSWIDLVAVIAFVVIIFYWAVSLCLPKPPAEAAVAKYSQQIQIMMGAVAKGVIEHLRFAANDLEDFACFLAKREL